MKTLRFCYFMELRFSEPVREHRFTLRCFPESGRRQTIEDLCVQIVPQESLSQGRDSCGNVYVYGYAAKPHRHFSVEVSGTAHTGLAPDEEAGASHQAARFKYQTDLTRPGPALSAFWLEETRIGRKLEQMRVERNLEQTQIGRKLEQTWTGANLDWTGTGTNLERAAAWMDTLFGRFRYAAGTTGVRTTAEQAMAQGMGVCQDYAHILLSLCRMDGIPCRYVAGLLPGEGESHAWTEIYQEGRWIALDPTHNRLAGEGYIRFCAGRDSADCSINRGVFLGQARQFQTVRVWAGEEETI